MDRLKFYIDGAWVDPAVPSKLGIVNPATEETFAQISLGSRQDVNRAAKAARRAFATYSEASVEERLAYLHKIIEGFRARLPELARMMTLEMGAPITFATERQADGTVLLRMTGGLYVGGGTYPDYANRHLPDAHVYRLIASPMSACR